MGGCPDDSDRLSLVVLSMTYPNEKSTESIQQMSGAFILFLIRFE
jgi:hypothetical protein